jgi:dihydrolipoamide dehydrogenase
MAWSDLDQDDAEIGQVLYRSGVHDSRGNRCVLRIYADRRTGQILGAAMIGSGCEEIGHLLAWAVQEGMTVSEALRMPSYHTAGEAVLRKALWDVVQRMSNRPVPTFRSEVSVKPRAPSVPAP